MAALPSPWRILDRHPARPACPTCGAQVVAFRVRYEPRFAAYRMEAQCGAPGCRVFALRYRYPPPALLKQEQEDAEERALAEGFFDDAEGL